MSQHFTYGQHTHTTTHKTLTLAAHKTCKWQSEFKDNTPSECKYSKPKIISIILFTKSSVKQPPLSKCFNMYVKPNRSSKRINMQSCNTPLSSSCTDTMLHFHHICGSFNIEKSISYRNCVNV